MRILLYTGKGGVGKTTTAAAQAVAAARSGIRTVVLSTDAAHSLGDAMGESLVDGEFTPIESGLEALQISAASTVEDTWRVVQDYLLTVLDSLGLDPVLADELTSLPGADELAAICAIEHFIETGVHDLVVVDCAPTAETLRLLALPEILAWHVDRLLPTQRAVIGALRPAAMAAVGVAAPGPQVWDAVRGWQARMRRVQSVLTSPQASVRLVLTPESVVIAESRRALTSLNLYGYAVDGAIVNRIIPPAPEGADVASWHASWNAAQAKGIAAVRDSLPGVPILLAPFLAAEPVGCQALAALAQATDDSALQGRAVDAPAPAAAMQVHSTDTGYALALALPGVTSADVELVRRDDDLVIDVAGHHRVVTLPSVLRRCTVSKATVRGGLLRVEFEPDQEVWPDERRSG